MTEILFARKIDVDALNAAIAGSVATLATADFITGTAQGGLGAERVATASTSVIPNIATGAQITWERAALTGDITAPQNSNATTLATVNANVGSFGTATQVSQFTVNAKGLITAAVNVNISLAASAVAAPGSDTQVLFNDGGALGADAGLVYAKATDRLGIAGGLRVGFAGVATGDKLVEIGDANFVRDFNAGTQPRVQFDTGDLFGFTRSTNVFGWNIGAANILNLSSTVLGPAANGGVALGTATLGYSNAFFSSGAVLNFNNGNVTFTHSNALLTMGGGQLNFVNGVTGNNGMAVVAGSLGEIMVQANGTGAAMMAFHRPAVFAGYLGLDTDSHWKIGGWSHGANSYRLWHDNIPLIEPKSLSPAQITSNQNDYNPTGLGTSAYGDAQWLRINTDASRDITGLAGGVHGRILFVHNNGTQNVVLKDENASSSAANRFALTADITMAPDAVAVLQYDGTSTRWRAVSGGGSGGTPVDVQVFTATGASTWTRPAGVTWVDVFICGGGGGGGGGGRMAASTQGAGGGGGGGGFCHHEVFKAADAGASQTVTNATGGTAGTGATVNGNVGTAGGIGGNSTFGSLITAFGGGGGAGGTSGTIQGGGGGGGGPQLAGTSSAGGSQQGGNSQFANAPTGTVPAEVGCAGMSEPTVSQLMFTPPCPYGGAGGGAIQSGGSAQQGGLGQDAIMHGPGGGAGGSFSTGNVQAAGGSGGRSVGCPTAQAGGAAGNNAGGSSAADFNYHPGCGGGGGGSSSATAAGAGGAGTNAGGGGGGGAGDNVNAGNGGAGGNGFTRIVSW